MAREDQMNSYRIVACWHVKNYDRLCDNLERGICDLWPQPRADKWFKRMRLQVGDRVRFCASKVEGKTDKGLIVANGTIASEPQLCILPEDPVFPMCVKIKNVEWLAEPLERCPCYQANPWHPSHRLGGKGPCS